MEAGGSVSCYHALFLGLLSIKRTSTPLLLFLLREKTFHGRVLGPQGLECYQAASAAGCQSLASTGSVDGGCRRPLCATRSGPRPLFAAVRQELDKAAVSMTRSEVAWPPAPAPGARASSGRPSPRVGVARSPEFQITGAIDLYDLS